MIWVQVDDAAGGRRSVMFRDPVQAVAWLLSNECSPEEVQKVKAEVCPSVYRGFQTVTHRSEFTDQGTEDVRPHYATGSNVVAEPGGR